MIFFLILLLLYTETSTSYDPCANYFSRITPLRACSLDIEKVASNPLLRRTAGGENRSQILDSDTFGISTRQHDAFVLRKCARLQVLISKQLPSRDHLQAHLLTNAMNFHDFLSEENTRRRRWIVRAIAFIWRNYQRYGLGAPELDPVNLKPSNGEWVGMPMFLFDNLDTLLMTGLDKDFWLAINWLSVSTVLEDLESDSRSFAFTQFLEAATGNKKMKPTEQLRLTLKNYLTKPELMNIDFNEELDLNKSDLISYIQNLTMISPLEIEALLKLVVYRWDSSASFDRSFGISFFETVIRAQGGLTSSFISSGAPVLLYKAWELGHRLIRNMLDCNQMDLIKEVENCQSIPISYCVPQRMTYLNKWFTNSTSLNYMKSSPAVIGSNQMEFTALSDILGICDYSNISNSVFFNLTTLSQFEETGLISASLYFTNDSLITSGLFGIGAELDSFYEYIVKHYLLIGDEQRRRLIKPILNVINLFMGINPNLDKGNLTLVHSLLRAPPVHPDLSHWSDEGAPPLSPFIFARSAWIDDTSLNSETTAHGLLQSKVEYDEEYHHLPCFLGGFLALTASSEPQWLIAAEKLALGCYFFYWSSPSGISPESAILNKVGSISYSKPTGLLRPELLESLTSLFHTTGKVAYRNYGWNIFMAMSQNAKVAGGFCSLRDVRQVPPLDRKLCRQDTWLLAETMKYLLLIFSSHKQIEDSVMKPYVPYLELRNKSHATVNRLRASNKLNSTCTTNWQGLSQSLFPLWSNSEYYHNQTLLSQRKSLEKEKKKSSPVIEKEIELRIPWHPLEQSGVGLAAEKISGLPQIFKHHVLTTEAHPLPVLRNVSTCYYK